MSSEIAYYAKENFESPINDFLGSLSAKERAETAVYLEQLAEYGNRLPSNYIKHIEGDLWELRPDTAASKCAISISFGWTTS